MVENGERRKIFGTKIKKSNKFKLLQKIILFL